MSFLGSSEEVRSKESWELLELSSHANFHGDDDLK